MSRINRLGGQVYLSVKTLDLMLDPTARNESVVLDWHRSVFGDTSAAPGFLFRPAHCRCRARVRLDGFQKVYAVSLDNTSITDAGLEFLKGRTELISLSLRGTLVTDAGIEKLAGLANLQKLQLSGTKITDAGLKYLARLPMLTDVKLSRTAVTDAGLRHIDKARHLQAIELDGTAVSKAERNRLKKLCFSHVPD